MERRSALRAVTESLLSYGPLTARTRQAEARQLRVLHVFPTFAYGGVPLRIVDVANRLSEAYAHRCMALDGRTDAAERLSTRTTWEVVRAPAASGGWLRPVLAASEALKAEAPDLLCTYNWGTIDWAVANTLFAHRPHLHFESGFGREEAQRTLRRRDLYRRLALRGADALVVPSRSLADLARARGWIAPQRIQQIVNGVDLAYYQAEITGRADTTPTVASVSPLRAEKGVDRLIRLFAQTAQEVYAQLLICGDGPERHRLETLVHDLRLHDRVTFAGQLADVRPVLRGCDVFAMTSYTEQMPNALLQAMASGRAVVAFDAGDIKAMLPEEQRPFVISQEAEKLFVQRLTDLIANPAQASDLGAANRRRVAASYDITDMVRAYDRLYRMTAGHDV